jgi:hypothetical protein
MERISASPLPATNYFDTIPIVTLFWVLQLHQETIHGKEGY